MLFALLNKKILSAQTHARSAGIFALVSAVLLLTACASDPVLPKSDPKLMGTKAGSFDHVLMMPGSGIPAFSRVFIEDPQVTFNKHWLQDFRGDYTDRDLERITTTYGEMLKKALREGMTEHTSVTVVDSAAEADVIYRPLLRELNIYAPDLSMPGSTKKYVYEAGNATFDLTLIQAGTDKVIAQFIDHRETSTHVGSQLERTNRVNNARHFRNLMERWTRNLTSYLIDTGTLTPR